MWSQPVYLVLAAASLFVGVFGLSSWDGDDFPYLGVMGVLGAVSLAGAYFASRRQVLIIASSGGSIRLAASSMSRETLDWFLTQLAQAKANRSRDVR